MSAQSLNAESFEHLVLRSERPALVEFWAPWCSHCHNLESAFDQLASQYANHLTVAKINIDEEPALAERYYIEFVPTLILFADGEQVDFVIAPSSAAAIEQFLSENLQP